MEGFVYVLTNRCMHGICKVGKTSRVPTQRCAELFTIGVPVPFDLELAMWTPCMSQVEKSVHDELEQHRVNGQREFFECHANYAMLAVVENVTSDYELLTPFKLDFATVRRVRDLTQSHAFEVPTIARHICDSDWLRAHNEYRLGKSKNLQEPS